MDNKLRCESNHAEKFAILLSGTLLDSMLKTLRLDQINVIPLLDPTPVQNIFETIFNLSQNKEQENFRAANAECYKLLMELSAQTGILTQPPDLREALQYINQNLTRNLKLTELCHHTGYSSATLTRKFQRSFNKSPIEFFLEQKLEKARVRYFLSINADCLPANAVQGEKRTYRTLSIDGEEFEFSEGFTELHTESYRQILSGNGFRISEARPSIEIVSTIRQATPIGLVGDYHPLAKLPLSAHPFGWDEKR